MGIPFEDFSRRDVYVFYDFEDVYFRFDHNGKAYFRKFVGEDEVPCEAQNRLLSDAIRFGEEVSKDQYDAG